MGISRGGVPDMARGITTGLAPVAIAFARVDVRPAATSHALVVHAHVALTIDVLRAGLACEGDAGLGPVVVRVGAFAARAIDVRHARLPDGLEAGAAARACQA